MLGRRDRIRVVGLTGGLCAGKSEVARYLRGFGIPVLDADRIGLKQARRGGPAYERLVTEFGTAILGLALEIDRAALARLAMSDDAMRRRLEAITHPLIIAEIKRRLGVLEEIGVGLAVIEAALLVETRLCDDLDGIVVVVAQTELRLARAAARGMSLDDARARMGVQVSEQELLAHADFILRNDGSKEELRREVARLAGALLAEATWRRD